MHMTQEQIKNMLESHTLVKSFKDAENGIAVFVTRCQHSFHVTLQDTDADLFVPTVNSCATEKIAVAYANRCLPN